MTTLFIIVHVAVCLFLIVIVLLQHGKGADIGATFGGSSQTVFGSEGPMPMLNKITTAAAIVFMVTSLVLAQHSGNKATIMHEVAAPVPAAEKTHKSAPETIPLPSPAKTDKAGAHKGDAFPVEKTN